MSVLAVEDGRLLPSGAGLTDEQQQALDLKRHVVVSAGAGSGKTRTLTRRVLRILGAFAWEAATTGHGPGPESILVVTFTDRAAGEMRERIRHELGEVLRELRARRDELTAHPVVGPRYPALLAHYERSRRRFDRARIGTFHGFCAGMLRELAAEAGLDPGFTILEGGRGASLRHEAVEAALQEAEPDADVDAPVFRHLRRRDVLGALQLRLNDPGAWRRAADGRPGDPEACVKAWTTRYGEASLDDLENAVAPGGRLRHALEGMLAFRPGLEYGLPEPPVLVAIEEAIATFDAAGADPRSSRDVGARADRVRLFLQRFFTGGSARSRTVRKAHHTWLGRKDTWRKMHRKGVRAAWESTRLAIEEELGPHGEALEGLPGRIDTLTAELLADLAPLAERAAELYRARKDTLHALDFDDLQARLLTILDDQPQVRPVVQRFRHVLVDELQDTNDDQWRLIRHVADLDGEGAPRMFLVGDRKQAIYRFRGGDVTLFDAVVAELDPRGAARVSFTRNFRSRTGLIDGFNRLFAWLMTPAGAVREPWEAPFAPLRAGRRLGDDPWPDDDGRIEIVTAADAVDEFDEGAFEEDRLVGPEREAAVVAGLIADVLPTAPRHGGNAVAVLLRRRRHLGLYARALRRAGVPHVVAGGRGFFARQEVLDVADVVSGLLHGGDVVALIGALRGPFFALEDAWLTRLALWGKERCGGALREGWAAALEAAEAAHLEDAWPADLPAEGRLDIARAATRWLRWGRLLRATPPAVFLRRMLGDAAAAHLFAVGDPSGQARANVEKLVRLAGRFDAQGSEGAAEFARFLRRREAEDTTEGEAVVDASAPVVLMTIHQSKGLEFPVVVLPDLSARVLPGGFPGAVVTGRVRDLDGNDRFEAGAAFPVVEDRVRRRRTSLTGRRIAERDRLESFAEAKRLLYVAATRARDRLICVLRPPSSAAEDPRPLTEAPAWEEWLRRWRSEDPAAEREVAVAWTEAQPAETMPTSPERPPPADLVELMSVARSIAPISAPDVVRSSPHGLAEQAERIERSALAEHIESSVPTHEAARPVDDSSEDPDTRRALGRLRGLLVHACLEDGIETPDAVTARRIRRALADEGLPATLAPRLEESLERHLSGFRSAAPAPLRGDGIVFREQSFRLPRPDHRPDAPTVLEGVIDVLYLDPLRDCWVVLDYKTDETTPAEAADRYRPQLLAYAWAASRILPDVRDGRRGVAAALLMTGDGVLVDVAPPRDHDDLTAEFEGLLGRFTSDGS